MGRAIVRDPQVFLFDEPLSNLDAKLRVQMRTEIKELHQRLKTTSIYVTHDQIEAMTMADKIVVMKDGVVEQTGDPLTLYDTPVNTFVAGFIGSPAMNMIPGIVRVNGAAAHDRVRAAAPCCRMPPRRARRRRAGGAVRHAARALHAGRRRAGCRPTSSSSSPPAPTRSSTAASTARSSRRWCATASRAAPATRSACRPTSERAHLFDRASGLSLAA